MRAAPVVALLLLLAGAAAADVPPPNLEGCSGKAAGDACKRDDGATATCKASTCGRLDYSQGTPPRSVSYDCRLCEGDPPAPAPGTSSTSRCDASRQGDGAAPVALGAALAILALRRRR